MQIDVTYHSEYGAVRFTDLTKAQAFERDCWSEGRPVFATRDEWDEYVKALNAALSVSGEAGDRLKARVIEAQRAGVPSAPVGC